MHTVLRKSSAVAQLRPLGTRSIALKMDAGALTSPKANLTHEMNTNVIGSINVYSIL